MKTARLTRYDVSASFSAIGFSSRSVAITGSDVAMIVPSRFSMNSAHAMISGRVRWAGKRMGDEA